MSISARLATGTILLLAVAGCTDNRMMDRQWSSPRRPRPPEQPELRAAKALEAIR